MIYLLILVSMMKNIILIKVNLLKIRSKKEKYNLMNQLMFQKFNYKVYQLKIISQLKKYPRYWDLTLITDHSSKIHLLKQLLNILAVSRYLLITLTLHILKPTNGFILLNLIMITINFFRWLSQFYSEINNVKV